VHAAHHAARRERSLSSPLSSARIDAYGSEDRTASPDNDETLSAREREVLQFAAARIHES
jgi:hypothetical protein